MKYFTTDYQYECIRISKLLKEADAFVLKQLGPNRSFAHAIEWSNTPRSGARWTAEENESLIYALVQANRTIPVLGARELAVQAWHHGRTANAVHEQLKKLKYWTHQIKIKL